MACALYKSFQGCNLLICNELFVVGRLTISVTLRKFIIGINIVFKKIFSLPIGNKMQAIMQGFKSFCGLPNIQVVIDGMHFSISKFVGFFSEDYFYHITCDDNIVCQVIVGDKKLFTDLFVGFFESVNDSKVLGKFGLYVNAQQQGLFNVNKGQDGFAPYLLGDKGYPLLSWLMTSHRNGETNILEMFYNKKHR